MDDKMIELYLNNLMSIEENTNFLKNISNHATNAHTMYYESVPEKELIITHINERLKFYETKLKKQLEVILKD